MKEYWNLVGPCYEGDELLVGRNDIFSRGTTEARLVRLRNLFFRPLSNDHALWYHAIATRCLYALLFTHTYTVITWKYWEGIGDNGNILIVVLPLLRWLPSTAIYFVSMRTDRVDVVSSQCIRVRVPSLPVIRVRPAFVDGQNGIISLRCARNVFRFTSCNLRRDRTTVCPKVKNPITSSATTAVSTIFRRVCTSFAVYSITPTLTADVVIT